MKIKIEKNWVIKDKEGNEIGRTELKECNSYVLQFLDLLYGQFWNGGAITITATTGSTASIAATSTPFEVMANAGTSEWGLVIGRGTTAVALADYALVDQILSGTAANSLTYQACGTIAPDTSGATRRFRINRIYQNDSGSTITINQTGIYCNSTAVKIMIERALESPPVAINNGANGTLTYVISITV